MTTDTPSTGLGRLRAAFDDPPPWLARGTRIITSVEIAIGATAVLLIFFLVLVQALQRYLPFDGWSWTGELARFALVWLTFTVAGVLVTTDGHIAIEMVDVIKSQMVQRVVRVICCLVVAVVGVGLAFEAWSLTLNQGVIKSPAMRMPMSWFYAISLIGFVSTVIRAVVAAARFAVLGVKETHPADTEGVLS